MLSTLVLPNLPQNKSPNEPVLRLGLIYLYCLLYLFKGFAHLTPLEQSVSPMPVAVVFKKIEVWCCRAVTGLPGHPPLRLQLLMGVIRERLLRLVAHVDRVVIVTVHIINKCQIIIGVLVCWVALYASLQVLHGEWILLVLEVSEAQVVLNLRIFLGLAAILIVGLQLITSLERLNRLLVVLHFVKSYTEIKVPFRALRFGLVELLDGRHL